MPTFTPTALAHALAEARKAALAEASALAGRLSDLHPSVGAGALEALALEADRDLHRLAGELEAEVKAKTAKPKRAKRAADPAPAAPPEPLTPPV